MAVILVEPLLFDATSLTRHDGTGDTLPSRRIIAFLHLTRPRSQQILRPLVEKGVP